MTELKQPEMPNTDLSVPELPERRSPERPASERLTPGPDPVGYQKSQFPPADYAMAKQQPTATAAAAPIRWKPGRTAATELWPVPPLLTALRRGLLCRCPACGQTKLFQGYLRVVDSCSACGAPLGQARADDAPPYFTIFVVGHVVVLAMVMSEQRWQYSLWVSAAIWLPMTIALSLLLLRPIKGATVGLMLRLGLMKSASDD